MPYYIYKVTNLINNKIYIGYHYSEDIEKDNYLGSGEFIMRSVRKHGSQNFNREILFEFENSDEAFLKERELVNEDFVKRRDTYNMKIGGSGWAAGCETHNKDKITIFSPLTNRNYYVNEDELQKFLDDGWILGNKSKGKRLCIKKDDVIKYIDPLESKIYLEDGWVNSNTTEGKICLTHTKTNQLKYVNKDEVESYTENGYSLGNLKSGVNKGTIYISKDKKNKRISEEQLDSYLKLGWAQKRYQRELKIKRMYNPNDGELKNIEIELIDEYLNNGWILGTNYIQSKNKTYVYITKDKQNKKIDVSLLGKYISEGWDKGMYNPKDNSHQ